MEYKFLRKDLLKIDKQFIEDIKFKARKNASEKFMYCLHESEDSNMQEIVFAKSRNKYHRPDKHNNCAETKIVLDGEVWIILFEDNGAVKEAFKCSSDDVSFCRIEKGIFHAIIPITEQVVIYEVREGKFTKDMNIFPDWAPETEDDIEGVKRYKMLLSTYLK